jgi:tripartite-type tricarboxylate transporter receptor subunit TctC
MFGAPQNNVPFEPLFGTKQANFDPIKFLWLGTPSVETAMLPVWHGVPVNSWQEVRMRELTVGASGVNSTPSCYARLLNETLGLKLKIIVGYQGQPAALVAMERGEIDGYASAFYSAMKATRADWMRNPRKVKLLVQMGPEKEAEIPDVPFLPELVANEEDRRFVEAACAPLGVGRPYMFPPDVPADRVAAMRKALAATFRDKAFVEDATRAGLDVSKTRSGEEVAALIERIYRDTPPALVERLRRLNNP